MSKLIDTHLDGANELVWTRDDVEVARLSSGNVFTFPPGALGGSIPALGMVGLSTYGAVGDTKTVSDGTTNGTTTVTSPTAAWTLADVGKTIVVREGTSATASLVTTIAAYVSATQVTLAASVAASIAGTANLLWGTDDTAAVVAWLNAFNAAGGGLAFAGNGTVGSHFIVNPDTTPLPQITVKGAIRGLGPRLTIFESLSLTADFFDRASDHLYFQDLEVRNAPRHPSAGSGIKMSSGQLGGLRNVRVSSFYNNVNCVSAYNWAIDDDCYNVDALNYGVLVQDQASGDRGDQCIGGVISTSVGGTGSAGIRYESGGGLKFGKLKITGADYGLDLAVADGATTSIALLAGVSIENQAVANVRLGRAGTTGVFKHVMFAGSEMLIGANKTNVLVATAGITNIGIGADTVMTGSGGSSIGVDAQFGTRVLVNGAFFDGHNIGVKVSSGATVFITPGGNAFNCTTPVSDAVTPANNSLYTGANRYQNALIAQGLISQNWDRQDQSATLIMTGGTAYAMLVGVNPGDVITNVYVQCTTAATLPTLFKAGIYSIDGATQYKASADQSSLFASNGVKTIPLSAAWTVPAGVTAVMVVIVATATTTLPTLLRGENTSAAMRIGTNAYPNALAGTGLSDLPAVTLTFAEGSKVDHWVGLG